MRKFLVAMMVLAIASLGALIVSADSDNASPNVPDDIAAYVAAQVEIDPDFLRGGNCGGINIDTENWGNASRFLPDGTFQLSGEGIGGQCRVDASPQTIMNDLCGFRGDGVRPRINTSDPNWGNGSRETPGHRRGDLKISGLAVAGHCWLSGAEADLALTLIPKFNR